LVLYQKIYFSEVIQPVKHLLLLLLPFFLFATGDENLSLEGNQTIETSESFLSIVEYGRMLYKNPRGISCSQCHGKEGKGGQKIAKYYDKKKNPKLLKGVDIREYSLDEIRDSLNNEYRENNRTKRHKIMPMYYLTNAEVEAIFYYLQESNKRH